MFKKGIKLIIISLIFFINIYYIYRYFTPELSYKPIKKIEVIKQHTNENCPDEELVKDTSTILFRYQLEGASTKKVILSSGETPVSINFNDINDNIGRDKLILRNLIGSCLMDVIDIILPEEDPLVIDLAKDHIKDKKILFNSKEKSGDIICKAQILKVIQESGSIAGNGEVPGASKNPKKVVI